MSGEYFPLDGVRLVSLPLRFKGKQLAAVLACVEYSEEIHRLLGDLFHAVIPARMLEKAGLTSVLTAFTAAYLAYLRGASIARRPGLDVVLYLANTRNLREALERYRPQNGELVLVVAAPEALEALSRLPARQCSVPLRPREGRVAETRVALFTVEARVYRFSTRE